MDGAGFEPRIFCKRFIKTTVFQNCSTSNVSKYVIRCINVYFVFDCLFKRTKTIIYLLPKSNYTVKMNGLITVTKQLISLKPNKMTCAKNDCYHKFKIGETIIRQKSLHPRYFCKNCFESMYI